MRPNSFSKKERLHKRKRIQDLFEQGSSLYIYPFKTFILPLEDQEASFHQVLISVSNRNFKRAVDRNRIKRRIREAYRKQKHILPESPKLALAFVYSTRNTLLFSELEKRLNQVLKKLANRKGIDTI
jgi:ribonuclease P protein component